MLVFKSELQVNQAIRTQVGATAFVGSDQISLPGSDTVVYLGQVGYQICSPARVQITKEDGSTVEGKITLRNLQINSNFAPTTFDRSLKKAEIFYYMVVADIGNRSIKIGDIVCMSAEEVQNLPFVPNTRLRHVRPTNDLVNLTPDVYTVSKQGEITKDDLKQVSPQVKSGKPTMDYKGFKLNVRVVVEGTNLTFNSVDEAMAAIDTYTRFNESLAS